jgi:hypothetical protein
LLRANIGIASSSCARLTRASIFPFRHFDCTGTAEDAGTRAA